MKLNGTSFFGTSEINIQIKPEDEDLGNFDCLPNELIFMIFRRMGSLQPQVSLVCRRFFIVNEQVLINLSILKIIKMKKPITLADSLMLSNELRLESDARAVIAFDVHQNKLVYALPKIKHDETSSTYLKIYEAHSGLVNTVIIPKTSSLAKNIWITKKGCILQNEFAEAYVALHRDNFLNPGEESASIEYKRIQFQGGDSSQAVHAMPNKNGVLAGTLKYSQQIVLYNEEGTILRVIGEAGQSPSGSSCEGLALSSTHLYAAYANTCSSAERMYSHSIVPPYYEGVIQAFSLENGALIANFPLTKKPFKLVVNEANTHCIVCFSNDTLGLLDINTQSIDILERLSTSKIKSFGHPSLDHMKINHNLFIGAFDDGEIGVWDLATKKLIHTFNWYAYKNPKLEIQIGAMNMFNARIQDMAICEHYIAIIPVQDQRVEIWNLKAASFIHAISLEARPLTVKFDKNHLAVSLNNGAVKLWKFNAIEPQNQAQLPSEEPEPVKSKYWSHATNIVFSYD